MSLITNLQDLATRIATESKALRTLINGNASNLSALTTTAQNNLVAAINELDALIGAAAATTLNDLTDVTISSVATGHMLRNNGSGQFVNVDPTVYLQPLDSDLTSIAALTTTSYGRALLELANQAALVALLPSYQPLDSDLTSIAALTTTSYGRALLTLADAAGFTATNNAATASTAGIVELATTGETTTGTDTTRAVTPAGVQAAIDALIASAPGTLNTLDELAAALGDDPNFAATLVTSLAGKQPLDTDLTAIAALTSAANKGLQSTGAGTWALYDLTTAGKALLDDADAAAQRTTLSVYSTTEIGDPTTNFVTTFEAGLT